MRATRLLLFLGFFVLGVLGTCFSQQVATGTPPFGSFGGGPFDAVNLGNLNVHFAVPIMSKAGRGMPFTYNMSYDSSVWYPSSSSGQLAWTPVFNWGWMAQTAVKTGYITYVKQVYNCDDPPPLHNQYIYYRNWAYYDPWGKGHSFGGWLEYDPTGCDNGTKGSLGGTATDGSGLSFSVSLSSFGSLNPATITQRNGNVLTPPMNLASGSSYAASTSTDANGNQITVNSSGQFYDTLSSTTAVLTVAGSGTPSSPNTFTYTPPSGTNVHYTMNYLQYTVKTGFGVSGTNEYGPLSNGLVSSVQLPDGTSYSFTYEQTPGSCTPLSGTYPGYCVTGRIASVTLPTGGTITYTYTGGSQGIESDGSASGLTRTLSTGGEWQYSRSLSGSTWTTTVTDPNSNQTAINFAKDSATTNPTQNFYETQRKVYQGSTSSGALLLTTLDCYNTNFAACGTANVASPITQKDAYRQLPSGQNALSETTYNGYGLPTEDREFDYGVTTGSAPSTTYLVRETSIAYASLSNGIVNRPSTVTIMDGSGNTKASTTYGYDETAVTGTTGTPQHISISGSRGNLTSVATPASTSVTLYRTFSYYDTGATNTSTDVSLSKTSPGASTTYAYGSGSCGNSFPTLVNEPLSLSRSMSYDSTCAGGLLTSVTDENSQPISANYTDAYFWRPASVVDQLTNTTGISYTGQTVTESSLLFNSNNSTSDNRVTSDGFGRPILSQRLQAPGGTNYDSVETDYDNTGRVSRVTMPFVATAGTLNSSAPATTTVYDALGRPTTITDGGSGTVSYGYGSPNNNDVLQTLGPAPTGESTKQKQSEYDGLGTLTSVCELTTALPGNGTCGQTTIQAGYWTKYTYDALGNLTNVVQNAQASSANRQNRSYVYDMLSRVTSETNPETGTTQYFYDSLTGDSACGTVSYPGNLVKKKDAVGNSICYSYDALHRVLSVTYPSGSYSSVTSAKHFVYDSATVNSVVMSNAKGRMAEAYTCTGSCTSKITDEGFSYSARGEITDVYESTPHSSGYYHVSASYWAHGALASLSGIPSVPTLYYGASNGTGLDGEGRVTKVNASSGTNPVTAVTYSTTGTSNPVGFLNKVTFGSSDNDSFTWDSNTGRMKVYTFSVNSQTDKGTLTWNKNGSLQKLVIADALNSADSQTCNYIYDDLQRVATAGCGVLWTQNFTYDAFGNITKSVPTGDNGLAFAPTYSTTNPTNQFTSIPGVTVAYDANGNLTTDNLNTYTWDADNHPVTVNAVGVTYDALGRMVEKNVSGTYTEFIYGPTGAKLATANGQTLVKALIALPGGAKVAYNSSGLAYYRHSDWLGSSRLASTPTRTMYSDSAYAPFGEQYAMSGTTDASFTGQEQDTASSLFDFPARRSSYSQGRWISPDPARLASVNLTNAQTWNQYAYVMNNPLALIDPTGLANEFAAPICNDPKFLALCQAGDAVAYLMNFTNNWNSLQGVQLAPGDAIHQDGGCANCINIPFGILQNPIPQGPDGGNGPNSGQDPANCGITVKCRGIQANSLGKLGFQHCDAAVTDASGNQHSLTAGPDPPDQPSNPNTVLNAWDTPLDPSQFTGNTTFTSTSCSLAGCLINSTDQWNASPVKPLYGPTGISIRGWAPVAQSGENSNQWLTGTFQGCGVSSIGINQFGSIW